MKDETIIYCLQKRNFLLCKQGSGTDSVWVYCFGVLYSRRALLIMHDQLTIYQLKFDGIAYDMLHTNNRAFQANVSRIHRRGNENVYQMTKSKYAHILRRVLTLAASDLIERCDKPHDSLRLKSIFAERIHYFTEEFLRISNEG